MSEHLPDVELTDEQEQRARNLWADRAISNNEYRTARLIVHLQDEVEFKAGLIAGYEHRVAELELKLNKAEIERAWAIGMMREASSPKAYQPGDKVKWIKGDAVRTVLGEYNAYRVSQHDGVGESLFTANELILVERATETTGEG